jgi:ankyrin repeat protein
MKTTILGMTALIIILVCGQTIIGHALTDDERILKAIQQGQTEQVIEMIKAGGSPNARDANGGTALMYAVIREDVRLVRFLLQSRADITLTTKKGIDVFDVFHAVGRQLPEIKRMLDDAQAGKYAPRE